MDWEIFLQQFSPESVPNLFSELAPQSWEETTREQVSDEKSLLLKQLREASPDDARSMITPYLQAQVAKTLGLDISQVDVQHPLNNMGLRKG